MQAKEKFTKDITLVFGNCTLVDVWQGLISAPVLVIGHIISQRERILFRLEW